MKNKSFIISFIGILLSIFILKISYWPLIKCFASSEYKTIESPDRRYKLVVYRTDVFPFLMPGQAGDAPGYVRLYDCETNKILNEKNVDMVQLIDQVYWGRNNVHIKLFAQWHLPNGG